MLGRMRCGWGILTETKPQSFFECPLWRIYNTKADSQQWVDCHIHQREKIKILNARYGGCYKTPVERRLK
jgi:hypothetical protein